MVLTPHILSGAALGANIKNPYLVAVSAVVLHFALDLFPHGDYLNKKSGLKHFWKVAIDLLISFFAVAAIIFLPRDPLSEAQIRNIIIGITFSLLPDLTTFLYLWMRMKIFRPVYNFHQKLHLIHYPDFAPEREFGFKNNQWDIFISLISIIVLLLSL